MRDWRWLAKRRTIVWNIRALNWFEYASYLNLPIRSHGMAHVGRAWYLVHTKLIRNVRLNPTSIEASLARTRRAKYRSKVDDL